MCGGIKNKVINTVLILKVLMAKPAQAKANLKHIFRVFVVLF
jgi:hypothetical protein